MFRRTVFFIIALLSGLGLVFGGSGFVAAQADFDSSPVTAALVAQPLLIAGGTEHTCVLHDDGSVKCLGSNRYGQLGNNLLTLHPIPINVSNLVGPATAIDAGSYHTCARIANGTVQCWGLNSSGQLGNGTTSNSSAPVTVSGLSGVSEVAAGYAYTCALLNAGPGGTVQCWGDNTYGQLGNGNTTQITSPGPVIGLPAGGVAAVTASLDHTCALLNNHQAIYCWGKNAHGQLGTGAVSSTPSLSPVSVQITLTLGTSITAISAGAQHTCALLSNNRVECWGDGSLGQMGNNLPNQSQNPTPGLVDGLTTATAISAGGKADSGHTCAQTSGGGVVCWGGNAYGQLGDGTVTDRNAPVGVSGLSSGVLTLDVGVNHSCALLTDHTVRCWGSDSSGQLGDGIFSFSTKPIDVSSFTGGVSLVGTGDRNTCALVSGQVWCWGNNSNGQLGDGSDTNRPAPTSVTGLTGTVSAIDSGMNQTCAIVNGGVQCWGNLNPTTSVINPPTPIDTLASGVTSLSVTNLHGCAVVSGEARCWGDNSFGQLGDGSTSPSYTAAVAVGGLGSGITQVSTGLWFSCALKANQTVWCWGNNANGQLGSDPAIHPTSNTPLQVAGLSSVIAVTAGQDHACALSQAGAMKCWGNNGQGQLGDGGLEPASFAPMQVSGLTGGVSAITAGGFHTCALVGGGIQCWGFNSFGQLGNGLTTLSKTPAIVSGLTSGMTSVIAGGVNYDTEQTCAITSAGRLKCWGGNVYGQLGDNLPILHTIPVRMLGLTTGPEIGVNYTTGKPGSYFRVAAANFPAGATLSLDINGRPAGTLTASAEGYAFFHIQANLNQAITLPITVSSGSSASTSITLADSNPLRLQEGSGIVFFVDTVPLYIPVISR